MSDRYSIGEARRQCELSASRSARRRAQRARRRREGDTWRPPVWLLVGAIACAWTLILAIATVAVATPRATVEKHQAPARAERLVAVPPPVPVVAVEVVDAPCPGRTDTPTRSTACTWPGGRVYVHRSGPFYSGPGAFLYRATVWHELGHQLAYHRPDLAEAFVQVAGPDEAGERFAVAYQLCAMRQGLGYGEHGYRPTRRQHAAVCRMLAEARP